MTGHMQGRVLKHLEKRVSNDEFLLDSWHHNSHPRTQTFMLEYEQFLDSLYLSRSNGPTSFPEPNPYFRKIFHAMAEEWAFDHTADRMDSSRILVTLRPDTYRPRQLFRDMSQRRAFKTSTKQSNTYTSSEPSGTVATRSEITQSRYTQPGRAPYSAADIDADSDKVPQKREVKVEKENRPKDTDRMAEQLRLSEKTVGVLVENHFRSLEDLELLAIDDVDRLHLPLRDASAIKRHLQSTRAAHFQTAAHTLRPPSPAYTEQSINRFDSLLREVATNDNERRQQPRTPPGMYKILLLGETGSGKSTLINYLTNYFLDGSLEDIKIAIDTQYYHATERYKCTEQSLGDSTVSKTSDCTVYDFQLGSSVFHCIDTPGLSDTGGSRKDDNNTDKIMTSALNAGNLSGVVIVINGTVARATANLKNTLVRMRGSMPDVVEKNLIVVLTNCTRATYNFNLSSLKPWTILEENVFFMNNLALSRNPNEWRNNMKVRNQMSTQWEESMNEIQQLIERIPQLGQTSTEAFKRMRERRDDIRAEISGIFLEIKKLQTVQDKLERAEKARLDATGNIQKYANFKQTKEITSSKMVDAPYHSTMCQRHQEELLCHERCSLQETATVGHQIFTGCFAFAGGKDCRFCGCGFETHFHAKKVVVKVTEMVENILQDEKAQFELHTGREAALTKDIGTFHGDMLVLQRALNRKLEKIEGCCRQLQSICKGFNFVAEMQANIAMMEADARTLTSLKAREASNEMVKSIREMIDQFSASASGSGKEKLSLAGKIRSLF